MICYIENDGLNHFKLNYVIIYIDYFVNKLFDTAKGITTFCTHPMFFYRDRIGLLVANRILLSLKLLTFEST